MYVIRALVYLKLGIWFELNPACEKNIKKKNFRNGGKICRTCTNVVVFTNRKFKFLQDGDSGLRRGPSRQFVSSVIPSEDVQNVCAVAKGCTVLKSLLKNGMRSVSCVHFKSVKASFDEIQNVLEILSRCHN